VKFITLLTVLLVTFCSAFQLFAQTKKLYVNVAEENLRNTPKGQKIGSVVNGTEMIVLLEKDNWVKVQVTGWIWKPSTTETMKNAAGEFHALHLLVKTREEAEQALSELKAGKDFSELARTKSIAPSAPTGGDLGYFNKGDFDPVIEKTIMSLKIDQVSEIIQTAHGFNIFKRIN
jgi:parvulin-like peptidyl-prolyl isomerase